MKWTKEEELNLIDQTRTGVPMSQIATNINRTTNAVILRLKKIIYENITKNKKTKDLANILNLPVDKIEKYYTEYKQFLYIKDDVNKPNSLEKISRQNKIMRELIDNIELRLKLDKYIEEGFIDEDIRNQILKS